MSNDKVFSKKILILLSLALIIVLIGSIFIQYNQQLEKRNIDFISTVNNEVKKSLNKKIFEIEGSIISLASFYQASEDFTT